MTRAARAKYGPNSGWWILRDIVAGETREFNPDSATLRGRFTDDYQRAYGIPQGRMPWDDWRKMNIDADHIDYVIYSYDTPIAYRLTTGEWVIPDCRYSVTTSKHQHRVRVAVTDIDR